MNISVVKTIATRAAGRGLLHVSKHSPEILTGAGVVGVVTAAVIACKATINAPEIFKTHKSYIEELKVLKVCEDISNGDYNKAVTRTYSHTAIQYIKLYGPAVTLGLASIACLVGAHGIMRKRNAALVVAYKSLEEIYNKYRGRVIEEFGEDKDREFRFGTKDVQVINEKTKKEETVKVLDTTGISQYARFFDQLNSQWKEVPEYNMIFLKAQQQFANDLLHARGHVFLNEVYDALDMPHTEAGALCGWVLTKKDDPNGGDNFIDFGMYDPSSLAAREFVNGQESAILLDFNVNGMIFDKI